MSKLTEPLISGVVRIDRTRMASCAVSNFLTIYRDIQGRLQAQMTVRWHFETYKMPEVPV